MKRLKGFVIFFILIILLAIGFKIKSDIKSPFTSTTGKATVVVGEGDSLFKVIDRLKEEQIIKNAYLTKFYIRGKKLATNIKPGEYTIDTSSSIEEFIQVLNTGTKDKDLVKVTIPEGYDIVDIADLLEKNGVISKEEFIKSSKEYQLPDYINTNPNIRFALEGYLFPDTYELKKGSLGKDIIDKMIGRFEIVVKDLEKNAGAEIEDITTLMTVASMIEKEARVDEDRAKIASVFKNRIKKDMKLQIDATVIYAIGEHRERLLYKDLEIDSPYNTYKVEGLPPGPICSPGKASIEAAINPEETNYVFYVLDESQKHYFTDNYNDFLKAKERYKQSLK